MRLGFETLEVRRLLTATSELSVLSFEQPVSSPISESSSYVNWAHLNDDTFADLVVGSSDGTLDLLLGDGKGAFYVHASYPNLGTINAVDFGDLNNDGLTDIVVSGTTVVTTLIGQADTAWEELPSIEGSGFSVVELVDTNGDNSLDLITRQPREIAVRFGVGDGTFADPITYFGDSLQTFYWTDGLAGDVNQDGHVDLVRSASDTTEILLNDGSGIFDTVVTVPGIAKPRALRELNGDGILDLIAADISISNIRIESRFTIHLGNEDGTFGEAVDQIIAPGLPDDISVSDFDSDGNVDLLYYQRIGLHSLLGSGPNIFLANGDGSFQEGIRLTSQPGASVGMAVVDVDNDGVDEIVTSRKAELLTYALAGTSQFASSAIEYPLGGLNIRNRLVEDINGDGLVDLAGSDANGTEVVIRLGNSTGFGVDRSVVLDGGSTVTNLQLVSGDFAGDGKSELAVLGQDSLGFLRIFIVNASTATVNTQTSTTFLQGLSAPISLDVDQDGRLDVVLGRQDELVTYLNHGNGEWSQHRQDIVDWAFDMDIIDANGDTLPDLVLQGRIYANRGDGSWEPWDKEVGSFADLNQDGFVDVVKRTGELQTDLAIRLNDGNTSWLAEAPVGVSVEATEFYLSDADGNGVEDLIFVVTSVDSNETLLRVVLADGNGGFGQVLDSPFVDQTDFDSLLIQDVDNDGNIDITTSGFYTSNSNVFLGDGQGRFAPINLPTDPVVVVRSHGFSTLIDVYARGTDGTELTTYVVPVRNPADLGAAYAEVDIGSDGDLDIVQSYDGGFVALLGVGPGDFDRDGFVNGTDVEIFRSVENPTDEELTLFDLNGDLALTEEDIDFLVEDIASTRHGDTDFDGDVDFADFLILASNFGKSNATWIEADFNGSGEVDFADFLLLAKNFGFERDS